MKKNKIKNKADDPMILSKETRDKLWRRDIIQEAIESGNPAHIRYISPLPDGDGRIHSIKGQIVSQDALYMFVKRPRFSPVRVLKSQMFLMTTQENRRRPRERKSRQDGDKMILLMQVDARMPAHPHVHPCTPAYMPIR